MSTAEFRPAASRWPAHAVACELWTADEAAAADVHTIHALGVGSLVLMERASLAVAAEIEARARACGAGPVLVLAGPGHNGGDGLAVARILAQRGAEVAVFECCGQTPDRPDGARAHQRALAERAGVTWLDTLPAPATLPAGAVLVDALLGTGSAGAPRGAVAAALAWAERVGEGPLRVAIDLPSGVEVDTGRAAPAAFRADVTVTMVRSKPGLHVRPGRDHAGAVVVADIGIVAPTQGAGAEGVPLRRAAIGRATVEAGLVASPAAHKFARGCVGVVGGGSATPGAAVLAAIAALRAGAGLVTIATADPAVRQELIAARPELMVAPLDAAQAVLPRADVLVVGPGLTDPGLEPLLHALWSDDPRPQVWDASALAAIPVTAAAGPRILTPHAGEAARMLQARTAGDHADAGERAVWTSARVEQERLAALEQLVSRLSAPARAAAALSLGGAPAPSRSAAPIAVVLKGPDTLVGVELAGQLVWRVNVTGSATLATAGSGDVLAGIVGALWSRRCRSERDATAPQADATAIAVMELASQAVAIHGLAGEQLEARGGHPLALDIAEVSGQLIASAQLRELAWGRGTVTAGGLRGVGLRLS